MQRSMLVVRTRAGLVAGAREQSYFAFRGIPYAASPTGLRWLREPEREPGWEGARPAQAWGATAPQRKQRIEIIPELLVPGADYLNVNVFTPDIGASGLPVMVWIHGGAFIMGTPGNPWYNPAAFANAGIVFVSITYRLGFEGLLPIPGYPANRSVHDWLAALTWVQECISAFGGDPDNITLAGQSAGSEACLTLLSMPRARGLFRRVIAMSGSLSVGTELADADELAGRAAAALKVPLDQLGSVAPRALLDTQPKILGLLGTPGRRSLVSQLGQKPAYLRPGVDGDLIPELPFDAVAAGAGSDVELLIGCTAQEANFVSRIFARWLRADTLRRGLGNLGLDADQIQAYLAAHGGIPRREILGQAITDRSFRMPVTRLATARCEAAAATYCYQFDWQSPAFLGVFGAVHGLDLLFAFNNLAEGRKGRLYKTAPDHLAETMHRAWADFVVTGDPGWPRYRPPSRPVMLFDTASTVSNDQSALPDAGLTWAKRTAPFSDLPRGS
jgi:para-nitrobenzyl esterase